MEFHVKHRNKRIYVPLACLHVIELALYLIMNLSSMASLNSQNKTALYFYFLLLVMSTQISEWRQVVSIQYLKHKARYRLFIIAPDKSQFI